MVSKWVITDLYMGYIGVITHLLTFYSLPGTSKCDSKQKNFGNLELKISFSNKLQVLSMFYCVDLHYEHTYLDTHIILA